MLEYTTSGCIDIVGAAFRDCLSKTKSRETIDERINFVSDSMLFVLWCIVTEQNRERLKLLTTIRNHSFLKECKQQS